MKQIQLNKGHSVSVDDVDYENLMKHNWSVLQRKQTGKTFLYACRKIRVKPKGRHYILMHRQILNAPTGMEVDHINGNGLDNRRENIRVCTKSQNQRNRAARRNSSSKYKGVNFDKDSNLWRAAIFVNEKHITLGRSKSEAEAARKYDDAARKYYGEFARLNFPEGEQK